MEAYTHWFRNKSGTTKMRPPAVGPVLVDQVSVGGHQRPGRVRGLVVTGTTAGRLSPPEPSDGMKVGFSASSDTRLPSQYQHDAATGENWHNDGSPIHDKGHIMAIEIGGPDVAANIVPQLANEQEHGEWRKMERRIKEIANAARKGELWFFTAVLSYPRELTETFSVPHRVLTPSHFRVTIHKLDATRLPKVLDADAVERIDLTGATEQVMYDGALAFTERDELESARLAMDVEIGALVRGGMSLADAEKEMGDLFDDVTPKFTTTQKTKKRTNKSTFNSRHAPPHVILKPHPGTPGQGKVALQARVNSAIQDMGAERRLRVAMQNKAKRKASGARTSTDDQGMQVEPQ